MNDRAEIKAVRNVLYERRRIRQLNALIREIDGAMNLDPGRPLQSDDIRNPPGSGPNWFLQATGELDPFVIEAADRCNKVADLLRHIRRDLAEVPFDGSDKRHLREGFEQLAASWEARAAAWRDPAQPDVEQLMAEGVARFGASVHEFRKVERYLTDSDLGGGS